MSIYLGTIVAVPQEKRAVLERFGKYIKYLEPGLHFKIPIVDQVGFRDIRERTIDIPPQSVITKDNVEVMVDGVVWIKVSANETDVKNSFYKIDDHIHAISELCHTNIRDIVANMKFDEALTSRAKIGTTLLESLARLKATWGATVEKVEIKEINPPADIKNAMHLQKTAEQTRRATVLAAEGRKQAAVQDKEAKIQLAQGEKEATILEAEGEKKAIIEIANGEADAIKVVNEAANKYFVGHAKDLKKLETARDSLKDNAKIILTPDMGGLVNGLVGSILGVKDERDNTGSQD